MAEQDPEARIRKVATVFDAWARAGRAEGMERGHGPVARRAFEKLALTRYGWYLDIGCGNGYTVRWAAAAAPAGRAFGLDVSPEMVRLARELSGDLPNVEFREGAFPRTDLPAGRFEAIFSMEVLYYLPDLDAALAGVLRLLAPGGRFACVVDYFGENAESHSWPDDLGVPMHLLDSAGWRDAFARAGFHGIEQERVRLTADEATADWKVSVGSLLTFGRRAEDA